VANISLTATPLAGLFVAETRPFRDERGAFARLFCARDMAAFGLPGAIAQINHSLTRAAGTVRGLHFQRPPAAEAKIVRCLRGRVFDVAVDLRAGSPTFLHWHGVELSAENMRALCIPRGFAHGFQTLEPDCELLYLHNEFYTPEAEGGLRCDDPTVGVAWPLPVTGLSARDAALPLYGPDFAPLEISK
jgi:dTDP-4-dehydrorhamnose 3,5-epimerase